MDQTDLASKNVWACKRFLCGNPLNKFALSKDPLENVEAIRTIPQLWQSYEVNEELST